MLVNILFTDFVLTRKCGDAALIYLPLRVNFSCFSLSSSDGSGNEDSGSTVILDSPEGTKKEDTSLGPLNPNNPTFDIPNLIRNRNEMQLLQQVASSCLMLRLSCDSSDDSDIQTFSKPKEKKPKHFYKLQLFQKTFLKIRFDRLALLALLDR